MSETILFPSGPSRPGLPSPRRPVEARRPRLARSGWVPCVLAALAVAGPLAWWAGSRVAGPEHLASADGAMLGKSFAPRLASALAEGFDAEAAALEAGKTVGEADLALKAAFHDARVKAFSDHVSPAFAAIVPPGSEPSDVATRKAFAKLHRDFARGLRRP